MANAVGSTQALNIPREVSSSNVQQPTTHQPYVHHMGVCMCVTPQLHAVREHPNVNIHRRDHDPREPTHPCDRAGMIRMRACVHDRAHKSHRSKAACSLQSFISSTHTRRLVQDEAECRSECYMQSSPSPNQWSTTTVPNKIISASWPIWPWP